jgi:hypothetical protein
VLGHERVLSCLPYHAVPQMLQYEITRKQLLEKQQKKIEALEVRVSCGLLSVGDPATPQRPDCEHTRALTTCPHAPAAHLLLRLTGACCRAAEAKGRARKGLGRRPARARAAEGEPVLLCVCLCARSGPEAVDRAAVPTGSMWGLSAGVCAARSLQRSRSGTRRLW